MTKMRQIVVSLGCLSFALGIVGCASGRPEAMSPNAVLETSGDKTLTWSATSPGNVTVYDENTEKIIYGTTIHPGQSVKVDINNNRVTLDSQTVSENILHRGDQYKIFFEPSTTVERTSTIETNTNSVETVHGH